MKSAVGWRWRATVLLAVAWLGWAAAGEDGDGECLVGSVAPCEDPPAPEFTEYKEAGGCYRVVFTSIPGHTPSVYNHRLKFGICGEYKVHDSYINCKDDEAKSIFSEEDVFNRALAFLKSISKYLNPKTSNLHYLCAPSEEQEWDRRFQVNPVLGVPAQDDFYTAITCICANKEQQMCNRVPLTPANSLIWNGTLVEDLYEEWGVRRRGHEEVVASLEKVDKSVTQSYAPAFDYSIPEHKGTDAGCPVALTMDLLNCAGPGSNIDIITRAARHHLHNRTGKGFKCPDGDGCLAFQGIVSMKSSGAGIEYRLNYNLSLCATLLPEMAPWVFLSPKEVKHQVSGPCKALPPGRKAVHAINFTGGHEHLRIPTAGPTLVFQPESLTVACAAPPEPAQPVILDFPHMFLYLVELWYIPIVVAFACLVLQSPVYANAYHFFRSGNVVSSHEIAKTGNAGNKMLESRLPLAEVLTKFIKNTEVDGKTAEDIVEEMRSVERALEVNTAEDTNFNFWGWDTSVFQVTRSCLCICKKSRPIPEVDLDNDILNKIHGVEGLVKLNLETRIGTTEKASIHETLYNLDTRKLLPLVSDMSAPTAPSTADKPGAPLPPTAKAPKTTDRKPEIKPRKTPTIINASIASKYDNDEE